MEKCKKSRKAINILFTISLYFLQIYIVLSLALYDSFNSLIQKYLIPFILVFAIIPTILGIINAIQTRGVARKIEKSIVKSLFIEKLILIPWFITNFIMWSVMVSGFLNPFLMIGIPIVIIIGTCTTYGYFLIINLNMIVYVITRFKRNHKKLSGLALMAIIFQFIYILDLIGDIILITQNKKNSF